MRKILQKFAVNCRAATAIEYGLILAMIAIACVSAFRIFGDRTGNIWGHVSNTSKNSMG